MTSRVGRPSRVNEVDRVCELSGASRESVRNFFHRPGRLSPELRQTIANAVATTGYRPIRRTQGSLHGVPVGYQMPKSWSVPSPVMELQFRELLAATQSAGAHLVPFTVDPRVPGVDDITGGTSEERADAEAGLQGWYRQYANTLAPSVYHEKMRERSVQMFVVNDLAVDDPRLEMLQNEGIPYVALGKPRTSSPHTDRAPHPSVETDNRTAIIEMVRILRSAGCSRFGHVGFSDDASHVTHDRRDAVHKAVGHVPSLAISYFDSLGPANGTHHLRIRDWLLAHDVDAVLCDSDALAYMVHLAAPSASRSTIQDPEALHNHAHRSLMLTGNDNSYHRMWLPTAERWMTMAPPERQKMQATVELLGELRSRGKPALRRVLIPPHIVRWRERLDR